MTDPTQIPGMIMTDPGSMDAFMNNQQLINQLGSTSANAEKANALKKQMAMADYIGQGPSQPSGRYIPGMHGAGVYVGPSALQTLGSGAQYALGAKMGMDAYKKENSLAESDAATRRAVMAMINEQNNRPPMYSPDMKSFSDSMQEPQLPPGYPAQ